MSIDPKTLPEATVIEDECGVIGRWQSKYLPQVTIPILRVFVPVPDGMTVEDATQALADHVQWVPLPDGPTPAHIGARVRQEFAHQGLFTRREGALEGFPYSGSAKVGGMASLLIEDTLWFIHPDDVPADPDAELIEAMASVLWGKRWDEVSGVPRANYLDKARAALAVVREHEAGTR